MKGKRILSEYSRDVAGLIAKYDRSIKLVGVCSVFYDPETGSFLVDVQTPEDWEEIAPRYIFDALFKKAFEKGWIQEVSSVEVRR